MYISDFTTIALLAGIAIPVIALGVSGVNISFWIVLVASFGFFILSFYSYYKKSLGAKDIPVFITRDPENKQFSMNEVIRSMKISGKDVPSEHMIVLLDIEKQTLLECVELGEDEEDWYSQLMNLAGKMQALYNIGSVSGKKALHLFLNCPIPIALGLGAYFDYDIPVLVWHYQMEKYQSYKPAIDLTQNPRENLRVTDEKPELITVNRIAGQQTDRVAILIGLGSHKPRIKEYQGDIVEISYSKSQPIPIEDFTKVAKEVYNVILGEINKGIAVDLYLNMPLPIAYAIGAALGRTGKVSVYHYFRQKDEYRKVIELNKVGY